MTTASWNGATIAESADTVVVERNHYFPGRRGRSRAARGQRHAHHLPVEGRRALQDAGGGWAAQPRRGVVLSRAEGAAAEIKGATPSGRASPSHDDDAVRHPQLRHGEEGAGWLDAAGVAYVFHDYKAAGVDPERLARWADAWDGRRCSTARHDLPQAA
jgi:hypothetical protein